MAKTPVVTLVENNLIAISFGLRCNKSGSGSGAQTERPGVPWPFRLATPYRPD
jgi:hypothetical protein